MRMHLESTSPAVSHTEKNLAILTLMRPIIILIFALLQQSNSIHPYKRSGCSHRDQNIEYSGLTSLGKTASQKMHIG